METSPVGALSWSVIRQTPNIHEWPSCFMFEQAFKNIDNVLWNDAGCNSEQDNTEHH